MFLPQSRNAASKQSIARPRSWQVATVVSSTLISVGTYTLIARTLGPQAFGVYIFVQWLGSIALPVVGVGIATPVSCCLVDIQSREPLRRIAGIFYFLWYRQCRNILYYCLLCLSLTFPFFWIFRMCTPGHLLLAVLSTLPLLLSSVAGITLRSLRRSDLLAILHLFGALATLLLVIIAIQIDSERIGTLFLAIALSYTIALVMAVACLMKLLPMHGALSPGPFLRNRLIQGFTQAPVPFMLDMVIWQHSELLLLAYWCPASDVGFYAISTTISAGMIRIAPFLFSTWLLPWLPHYWPGHRYFNPYDAFIKTSCYIVFLAVPICMFVMICCPTLITFALGDTYLPLKQSLRILLLATVFGSIATISLTHLNAAGQKNIRFDIAAALLKIILAVPCIALWGIVGAAFACALAQIASAIGSILLCRKMLLRHEQTS